MPGVSIFVKGTTLGTLADVNGKYTLTVPDPKSVISFSFIGYNKQEITLAGQRVLDVRMAQSVEALEEVVVVGYGTVKKSDLTGAVGSIKSEDFNKGVVDSPQNLIAGKIPGVQIIQNSSEPGGGFSVSVRGVSSINAGTEPLYVIDGLPLDNSPVVGGGASGKGSRNPLSSINPNDIESIEVLKDASASAIYGARGSNGVVLIATKKGKSGKLKIVYDYYLGVQNIARKMDLLNANDYQSILNNLLDKGATNAAKSERVTEIINGGTDWQKEVFRDNAKVKNHNLSVSGGNQNTSFFIGLNYFNQEGIVKNSSFEKYGLRLNIDHKVRDNLKFGVNINSLYHKDGYVPGGDFGGNSLTGVLNNVRNYDPTVPVYSENGDYYRSEFMGLLIDNPVAILNGYKTSANAYRTFGVLYGEYKFLHDFTFGRFY